MFHILPSISSSFVTRNKPITFRVPKIKTLQTADQTMMAKRPTMFCQSSCNNGFTHQSEKMVLKCCILYRSIDLPPKYFMLILYETKSVFVFTNFWKINSLFYLQNDCAKIISPNILGGKSVCKLLTYSVY